VCCDSSDDVDEKMKNPNAKKAFRPDIDLIKQIP
jgi:hypothetical protein